MLTVERYLVLDMAEMYLLYVYWLLISCVLLLCKYYINRQAHYLLYWYDRGMELDDFYILYTSIWTLIVKVYEFFSTMSTILYVKQMLIEGCKLLFIIAYLHGMGRRPYYWNTRNVHELSWEHCETNYTEDVLKNHKFSYYTISNQYT